jgi:hypothetical protein
MYDSSITCGKNCSNCPGGRARVQVVPYRKSRWSIDAVCVEVGVFELR